MVRLFFGLLLILGLGAACFGGWQLFAPTNVSPVAPVAPSPVVSSSPGPISSPPPPEPILNSPPVEAEEPVFGPSSVPRGVSSSPSLAPVPAEGASPLAAHPQRRRIEDALRQVPIAYETPEIARFGKPFDVVFSLDATGAGSALGGLPGTGEIVEAQARVSERVKASLIGAAFDIELVSPDIQLLGEDTQNIWRWRVIPKEAGEQTLYVELFTMIGEDVRPVRTFNGQVTVEVTQFQKAVSLATAANPLAVFLGGIGSTLGGLFGLFRFFGRK